MSIEQLDNEQRYRDKEKANKEKKKEEFWLEKEIHRESSELIAKLASQIAREFGIEISEAKNLISWEVSGDLHNLKSSLSHDPVDTLKLWKAISSAKLRIEDLSKKHREKLKNSLDTVSYSPEKHEYVSSKKILWNKIVQRAQNPGSISDQLIWVGVWIIDSTEAIVVYSYEFGKWILLSPYHLYMILTWQWECEWFKNI